MCMCACMYVYIYVCVYVWLYYYFISLSVKKEETLAEAGLEEMDSFQYTLTGKVLGIELASCHCTEPMPRRA